MNEGAQRFETKKSLGQHFLNSPTVPRFMCDAAFIEPGDVVVEVGPGTGILTDEILARGANVIALEADKRANEVLEEKFADAIAENRLTIHHVDMRTYDLADLSLPKRYKVVANIPYYLSGMLFRTFLEHHPQPETIVFLVQKEVAKRITASRERGEKESLLSLSVKLYGMPEYVRKVPRGHFTPPPKVDSAIVAIRNISTDRLSGIDAERFFALLHLGFGKKRKQLLGNLSETYSRETLTHIFSTLDLSLSVRAEDLDLETWLLLARSLISTEDAG